jgi:hypothetical protein
MTKDEALKLALHGLEMGVTLIEDFGSKEQLNTQHKAIAAIYEALAQPEQEPLEYWNAVEGWVKIDEVREHFDSVGCGTIYKTDGEGREPLYTTPPQRTWVGLTQEEIEDSYNADYKAQTRAIEAKLKELNS